MISDVHIDCEYTKLQLTFLSLLIVGYIQYLIMPEFIPWKMVSGFMAELRDAGFEANCVIRRAIGEETAGKRQFIIAMLASKEEILHNDLRAIIEYMQYVLQSTNASPQTSNRYLLNKRIITLLNSPRLQKHGEARLLDPHSTILREVLQQQSNRKEDNYLAKMKESFHLHFGYGKMPILLLFSYFIPCTLEDHQCAKVLNEYAKRNCETIFVAYETVFRDTDPKMAVEQMVDKNVRVIPKKYMESCVYTNIGRLLEASRHCYIDAVTYYTFVFSMAMHYWWVEYFKNVMYY